MPHPVEAVVTERRIVRLVHFTRLANVSSILEHGLIPRSTVAEVAPTCITNDCLRIDARTHSNCLSITFPNSRMFYSYMMEDQSVAWAILLLNPQLLLEDRVLFCKHNAADNRIRSLPDEALRGVEALKAMFEEIEGVPTRADQNLKLADPTDVQAEILVKGVIDPVYFDGIVFQNSETANEYAGAAGNLKCYTSDGRGLFGDRNFYRTWGKGK